MTEDRLADCEDSEKAEKQDPAAGDKVWDNRGAKLWSHWFEVCEDRLGGVGGQPKAEDSALQRDRLKCVLGELYSQKSG